jgi:hypothetical protein
MERATLFMTGEKRHGEEDAEDLEGIELSYRLAADLNRMERASTLPPLISISISISVSVSISISISIPLLTGKIPRYPFGAE